MLDRPNASCAALLFVLAGTLAACNSNGRDHASDAQGDATSMRQLSASDLSFAANRSTEVVSRARKFILPVPPFGRSGEPLVVPAGQTRAGQPILDYEGKPIGDRGLVFFNGKDQTWQAAVGDGQAVVIINETTDEQAERIDEIVRGLAAGPVALTLPQLKAVLETVRTELGLGDMYNSTRAFIEENMSRAGTVGSGVPAYGLFKRDDRDICQAVYVGGPFTFQGPAGSPQQFPTGGVVVMQSGEARGVQPDIFVRTYRLADGSPIRSLSEQIAAQ